MNRRDFMRLNARGAMLLAAAGLAAPDKLFAATEPDVAVAHGKPGPATRAAVELMGGMKTFVKPGQRVVIKPNMSFAKPPEMATTTHPDVVKELAVMCRESGAASVLVLDNPLRAAELCLERAGIYDACREIDEHMVQALDNSDFFAEADIPDAREMHANRFMKDLLKADVLIAAPVAKSHGGAGVSLSLKGMMGLVLDRGVMHARYDLSQAIVDLNRKCKADLAVVDATRVLTTNGPYGPGKVDKMNMVIASKDPVAADATTVSLCEWWGRRMRPDQVKHIRLAHEQGLGRMDVDNLQVANITV